MNSLKNSSLYRNLLNNLFHIAFFTTLLLVALNEHLGLLPFSLYGFFLFRKERRLFRASCVIGIVLLCRFFCLELTTVEETGGEFSGEVIEIVRKERYQRLVLKEGGKRILLYDYGFSEISLGDVVRGSGEVLATEPARIEGGFDYKEYLKRKKVVKSVQVEELETVGRRLTWRKAKEFFNGYAEKHFKGESLAFIKAMLVGDDDSFSEELQEAVLKNGILHLFAVSGLHIIIFVEMINKILQFFNLRENTIIAGICVFLFLYLMITGFAPSVLRAALMYYLSVINKKLKLGFSSLDIISFCFILLLLLNPYYMYDHGFVLSFLASFTIILLSPLLSEKKNHFLQLFYISVATNLITFPVTINLNNEINLLSPLSNVVFIDLVEGIILPVSLLVFALPVLARLYEYLVSAFEKAAIFFARVFYIPLRFPDFSLPATLVYYSLLVCLCLFFQRKSYRRLFILLNLFFLFFFSNLDWLRPEGEIDFLDLYNGEAIFIRTPFGECRALIDTGDGSDDDVVDFLKSKGVKELDYLFLTHGHADHSGGAPSVISNFSVKKIVKSAYDDSGAGENGKILRVKAGDRVSCGSVSFLILHPDCDHGDENENSIVIYARLGNKNFLFLGDAGRKVEESILEFGLEADVVKISHHGSRTGTSPLFISRLRPEYAVIQTGRIERFGFPHEETIATLEEYGVKVFRTDLHYSIKYRFRKNESIFETMK